MESGRQGGMRNRVKVDKESQWRKGRGSCGRAAAEWKESRSLACGKNEREERRKRRREGEGKKMERKGER